MNRSGVVTISVLLLILVLVFVYYFNVRSDNQNRAASQSVFANVLSETVPYTDIHGNPVSLADYNDSIVVAVAWASWCPDCVKQLTALDEVASNRGDVKILAFNRAEPRQTAVDFLEFHKLTPKVELIMDPTDNFFKTIVGRTMPETVIFDADSNIVHHARGVFTSEEIALHLTQIDSK